MFVQISNSRLRKKKSSPRTSDGSDNDDSMKEEEERSPHRSEQQFTDVDLEARGPADEVVVKGGRERIFGKIGEKAKGLKGGLGRLFGEKEPSDVRVYTIDREMKGTELADRRRVATDAPQFASSELSEHQDAVPQRAYAQPDPSDHPPYVQPEPVKFQRGFGDPGHRTRVPATVELTDRLQRARQPAFYDVGATMKPVAIQATPYPPYRLHFLPPPTWNDTEDKLERFCRLVLSQAALLVFLIVWILFGALLLYCTEGYAEEEEFSILLESQSSTRMGLSTDLVHFISESADELTEIVGNSTWMDLINIYFEREDHTFNEFLKMGYSVEGEVWNFSGSILVCVAFVTTLGYGFPLPNSVGGIISSLVYAVVGLPVNYYLLKNSGRSLAAIIQVQAKDMDLRLQTLKTRVQNLRKFGESREEGARWPEGVFEGEFRPPIWLPAIVPLALFFHYLIGMVLFGITRGDSAYAILLFPCYLSATIGSAGAVTRLSFAIYLELTALLISTSISLCSVPSPTSLIVDPLIQMNVFTDALD